MLRWPQLRIDRFRTAHPTSNNAFRHRHRVFSFYHDNRYGPVVDALVSSFHQVSRLITICRLKKYWLRLFGWTVFHQGLGIIRPVPHAYQGQESCRVRTASSASSASSVSSPVRARMMSRAHFWPAIMTTGVTWIMTALPETRRVVHQ